MKIKKTFFAFALILCLSVSAVLLTACGGNDVSSLFGQTLSFCEYQDISKMTYVVENKEMKLDTLVEKYFDKIDWQATLGKTKEEVKDASNAIKLMTETIYKDIDEKALKAIKFEFSNEEVPKVSVGGNTYDITENSLYEYKFKTGKGEEEIAIRYERKDVFYYTSTSSNNSALPMSETNSVFIKFLEPTIIAEGAYGDISVSGRVLFKVQKTA